MNQSNYACLRVIRAWVELSRVASLTRTLLYLAGCGGILTPSYHKQ